MKYKIADDGTIELSDFNAREAYKIARKLEKDGIAFYQRVQAATADERIKAALAFLLEAEKKHLAFFEAAIERVASGEEDFDDSEIVELPDTHVFGETAENNDLNDPHTVIALGAGMEKKAIAFYTVLLQNTADDVGSQALQAIIEEEKHHLETFNRLL